MAWVKGLSTRRTAAQRPPPPPQNAVAAPNADLGALAGLGISDKGLARYGAHFKGAVEDLRAIVAGALVLRPHLANQYGRVLERFYGELGAKLDKLPVEARDTAVKPAVAALRKVAVRVGATESIVGAIAGLGGLLFTGRPDDFEARAERASTAIIDLLGAAEGRTGLAATFFGLRNMVELAETKLISPSLDDRARLWKACGDLLLDLSPASGATQGDVGSIVGQFQRQLKAAADPFEAISLATESAKAALAGHRDAIRQQIRGGLAPQHAAHAGFQPVAVSLEQLLDRHWAGPDSLHQAVEALTLAIQGQANRLTVAHADIFKGIAQVLDASAGSPATEAVLRYLAGVFPAVLRFPQTSAHLLAVKTFADVPKALLRAQLVTAGVAPAAKDKELARLDVLGPVLAARVAITVMPHLGNPNLPQIFRAAVEHAPLADGQDGLQRFVTDFVHCYPPILALMPQKVAEALQLAVAEAIELHGGKRPDHLKTLSGAFLKILETAPNGSIAQLLRPTAGRESSLVELRGKNALDRNDGQLLQALLPAIKAAKINDDLKITFVRRAIGVALSLARLDRDPAPLIARIQADWARAFEKPADLHFAPQIGNALALRANVEPSALSFLEQHPNLPAEVAITAGLHLQSDQLAWLEKSAGDSHSHGRLRELRDLVFAVVEGGRIDLLDAIRNAKDSKIAGRVLSHAVREYRQGRWAELAIDDLIKGLAEGRDPTRQVALEVAAPQVAIDPKAAEKLAAIAIPLNGLRSVMKPGQKVFGDDSKVYRETLEACIADVAAGTWPSFKFDGEIGQRQLAGLTEQQRLIWMQEDTTAPGEIRAAPSAAAGGAPVIALVAGLEKLMAQGDLSMPGLPGLAWDRPSLERLITRQTDLLDQLRGLPKGDPGRSERSQEVAGISQRRALLELQLALRGALDPPGQPTKDVLGALRPFVSPAIPAMRRLLGPGAREALAELEHAMVATPSSAPSAPNKPSGSSYATDEHNLAAYVTSFDTACISAKTGQNRASMVELIASAQYKMGRVFSNGKPVGRTILRLVQGQLGDYQGFMLRMDPLIATTAGVAVRPEDVRLMFEHALNKATAMGIPLIFNASPVATKVLTERGRKSAAVQGVVNFDRGHTGVHHTEGFSVAAYFTAWAGTKLDGASVQHRVADGLRAGAKANTTIALPP